MDAALFRPCEECVERRAQLLTPVGKAILHLGRHLVVDDALHDAITLHLPELLDQHLLRDCRNSPFEVREAQNMTAEQVEEDYELPTSFPKILKAFSIPSAAVSCV